MLGFDEFCGFFYQNVDSGGVGDMIADILQESHDNYVVVIDGSPRGFEFARFAACVATHCLKVRKSAMFKNCRVTKPKGVMWKEALTCVYKCRSAISMRESMTEYYNEHLAHVV